MHACARGSVSGAFFVTTEQSAHDADPSMLCCQTQALFFRASEKKLTESERRTRALEEGALEGGREGGRRYHGGVIKEAKFGEETLKLASWIFLISPLQYFMNHNFFLSKVMCPEDRRAEHNYTHTATHDSLPYLG